MVSSCCEKACSESSTSATRNEEGQLRMFKGGFDARSSIVSSLRNSSEAASIAFCKVPCHGRRLLQWIDFFLSLLLIVPWRNFNTPLTASEQEYPLGVRGLWSLFLKTDSQLML